MYIQSNLPKRPHHLAVTSVNGHFSLEPINFPIKPILISSPLNSHLTPRSAATKILIFFLQNYNSQTAGHNRSEYSSLFTLRPSYSNTVNSTFLTSGHPNTVVYSIARFSFVGYNKSRPSFSAYLLRSLLIT